MTAISVKVQGGYPSQRKPRPHFLEILIRRLIILCTALAVVLSSIAVCDGHWLQAPGGRMFGLWHFCTFETGASYGRSAALVGEGALNGAVVGQEQTALSESRPLTDQAKSALPNCTTRFGKSGVAGVDVGLGLSRSTVSLAAVAATFGLELLVLSELSDGRDASRRWSLGSVLVLVAAALSATGVAVFVALFRAFASPMGFTLTFWGQFTAVFLFFLNGMAAHHIHHMNASALPGGTLGNY